MKFFNLLTLSLRRAGFAIAAWGLVSNFADQLLVKKLMSDLASTEGSPPTVWIWVGISMLVSLISPLILTLLVFSAQKPSSSLTAFLRAHMKYLTIEELRAFGKSFLWCFALIIPGLIRFLQYIFVPYVVVFDTDYQAGRIDALESSKKIFSKHWPSVLLILVCFSIILPIGMTAFDEYQVFLDHPISAIFLSLLQSFLNLTMILLLFLRWQSTRLSSPLAPENSNESNLSLE